MGTRIPFSQEYYLWFWENALKYIAGWSRQEFDTWLEQTGYRVCLENEHDILYHASPEYWILRWLVPSEFKDERGNVMHHMSIALLEYFDPKIFYEAEEFADAQLDLLKLFEKHSAV